MAHQGFTAVIASAAATSNTLDLGSAGFRKVFINNEAGGAIHLNVGTDSSTFSPLQVDSTATAAVGYSTHTIGSAFSGKWVPVDLPFRYVQVEATGAAADGANVYFATSF